MQLTVPPDSRAFCPVTSGCTTSLLDHSRAGMTLQTPDER